MNAQVDNEKQYRFKFPLPDGDTRRRHVYHLMLVVIAAAYLVYCVLLSDGRYMVIDEVYQLDFCMHHGFIEVLTLDPYATPLFSALAWVWYRIVPYGITPLRMLTMLFATGTIFFGAGCANTIAGRRAGILAALLIVLSSKLMTHGALNFRPYALYAMLGAWVLYLYLRRLVKMGSGEKLKPHGIILSGIAMALLGYTHYLGLVFCVILFALDIVLLVAGKLPKGSRLQVFAPYAIAVVLYLPWMAIAFRIFMQRISPAVQAAAGNEDAMEGTDPSVVRSIGKSIEEHSLRDVMDFLSGSHLATSVFILCMVILAVITCVRLSRHTFTMRSGFPLLVPVMLVICMISPFYYLAAHTDIITSFWVNRYFMPLLVCISVVIACTVAEVLRILPRWPWLHMLMAIVVLVGIGQADIKELKARYNNGDAAMYQPFTDYLLSQPDIQSPNTAWLTYSASKNRTRELSVWDEYIFDMDGRRDITIFTIDGCDMSVRADPDCIRGFDTLYVSMQSNNFHYPTIPQTFMDVVHEEYVLVDTYRPYPRRHPKEWVRMYVRAELYAELYGQETE